MTPVSEALVKHILSTVRRANHNILKAGLNLNYTKRGGFLSVVFFIGSEFLNSLDFHIIYVANNVAEFLHNIQTELLLLRFTII